MTTRREVFDKVKNHLLTQNAISRRDDLCAYRGADGMMCAAGVLIEESYYCSQLEGGIVDTGIVSQALVNSGVSRADLGMVRELQRIHDQFPVHLWPDELDRVELEYLP